MAVDLTQLAAALRLGDGENPPAEPVAGIIARLLGVSQAFVQIAAPEAPEAIADEATIRMTATLYDAPTAPAGDRYAAAWRNSGAEALVSRWVVRRAGSEGEGVPAGGPSTGGLDDAGNGGTPTPATPTPPAVLVDAVVYSAHGDVTAAGWRDYDFVQLFYAVGGNTYITPPMNTVQLIGLSPLLFGMSRNVAWTLAISTTDDDVINVTQAVGGNTVPAPTATSTMTVIAWRS